MFTSKLFVSRLTLAGAALAIIAVGAQRAYSMFKSRKTGLPSPGWRKQDPKELDKLLDIGLKDSMATSDPVSVTQPDVHRR